MASKPRCPVLEPRLQVTAALLHRAFYPQGLSCTCFTRQRHSYPHYGKLSITWCICCSESHHTLVKKHMSPYVNRGVYILIHRKGKYVSQCEFAYFGADFLRKKKGKGEIETLAEASWRFVPLFLPPSLDKSLCACWEESVLRCGSLDDPARMECAGWGNQGKSQWVRG